MASAIRVCVCMLLAAGVVSVHAARYVAARTDSVGVFRSTVRAAGERPLFVVGATDRLQVKAEAGGWYRVVADDGREGWVERRLVGSARIGARFIYDAADVTGHLDNPEAVFILDCTEDAPEPIALARSFRDAIGTNVDRNELEKQAARQ